MDSPRRLLRNLHLDNVQKQCTTMKIPTSPHMKALGFGTGVTVYKLELSPRFGEIRSPLAVKKVSNRINPNKELFNKRIKDEAEILRKLSHPNIVGFRGIQCAQDGTNSLALECCSTSLGNILEEAREENLGALPAKSIHCMIRDIASALDYLHMQAKLLHGDIKSFNVLVKEDFEICKLCDFGVSLPLDDDGVIDFRKNSNLRYVGTNLWSAPEVMDESDVIDCKADIFSFGLVIYETIALVPPHTLDMTNSNQAIEADKSEVISESSVSCNDSHEVDSEGKENNSEASFELNVKTVEENSVDDQMERIDALCGTRPPLPDAFELTDDYNLIMELFYICTNEMAEDRPTAKTISDIILKKFT